MKILKYKSNNFWKLLNEHLSKRQEEANYEIDIVVKSIIDDIKKYGDDKIIEFANNYDKILLKKNEIKLHDIKNFYSKDDLNKNTIESFKIAIKNIKTFHEKQFPKDYEIINEHSKLKSIWKPIDSVGIYIP